MHFVALLERRNGSVMAQMTAAADYIFDKWVAHEYHKVGLPTWGRSKSEVDAFITDISIVLKEHSVAPPFFTASMSDSDTVEKMIRAAAEAERTGGSREDQITVAARVVTDRWAVLPSAEQDRLWEQDFEDVMRAASAATNRLRALTAKPTSN